MKKKHLNNSIFLLTKSIALHNMMKLKFIIIFLFPLIIDGQCWKGISSGPFYSGFIDTGNNLIINGSSYYTKVNIYNRKILHNIKLKQVKISNHVLAIDTNNNIWTWGNNDFGQLGNNSLISEYSPTKINGNWDKIATGSNHSVAIKHDGSLWCWGFNMTSQLGIGTLDKNRKTPVRVGSSFQWKEISAGCNFTIAIKKNGTLWSWGSNDFGELGNGTNKIYSFPTQIGKENTWKQVCAGNTSTLAIKQNGELWAWGRNDYGQFGNGTKVSSNLPIRIGTESNWIFVATSYSFSMGIKKDGSLWAWGSNKLGQLSLRLENDSIKYDNGKGFIFNGNLIEDEFLTPTLVDKSNFWTDISLGFYHAILMNNKNEIWVSGYNPDNRIGDGSKKDKIIITKIICK